MLCSQCGSQNRDDAKNCQICGATLAANPYQSAGTTPAGGPVSNYLWPAIAATVFCFFPFGILAIVYAIRVNSCVARGDYQGALAASKSAKIWCWASFALGLVFYLVVVAFTISTGFEQLR